MSPRETTETTMFESKCSGRTSCYEEDTIYLSIDAITLSFVAHVREKQGKPGGTNSLRDQVAAEAHMQTDEQTRVRIH